MEDGYTRITSGERAQIEEMINEGVPLKEIAATLGKSPTSVSREVKRNRVKRQMVAKSKFRRNPCKKRETCTKMSLCRRKWCKRLCAKCEFIFCHDRCDEFVVWRCESLGRWPYVCNRCTKYSTCSEQRYSYDAKRAGKMASSRASLSRKGLAIDTFEAERINMIVTPLLKLGQSPYHIWKNHREELGISLATLYSYINAGLFEAGRMQLNRAVNFRPRKRRRQAKDKRDFTGRTYQDYLVWMEAYHEEDL
jgi:IS30 family transposase